MHKLVVLYGPPVDPDHFRDYYVNQHLPMVRDMPGLRAWRYALDVASAAPDGSPYFAVFEAEFDSADAMAESRGSDAGRKVAADVPNYATGGATILTFEVAGGS